MPSGYRLRTVYNIDELHDRLSIIATLVRAVCFSFLEIELGLLWTGL